MNNYIYKGHLIRKRFGQNFLHDNDIISSIVAALHPQPGQAIVEIGPGFGTLTKPVIEHAKRITAIEVDRNLVTHLTTHPFFKHTLNVLQQDVMTVDFTTLCTELGQPLRLFGNLPYNISTPLIFYLFRFLHAIHDMHFMLQKEVVNRLVATPNNKNYGRLSIMAQYYCQIIPILEVPPTSFKPVPKVDSVVVRLKHHTAIPFLVHDLKKLFILTTVAFHQRRKTLRNSLSDFFSVQQLIKQGIDASLRAENISVEQYCRLANLLEKRPAL